MHPDVPKSLAFPVAGILAATAETRTNVASPSATPDSGSAGMPRVYSAGHDSRNLKSLASYPITRKANPTRPPITGSDTVWKTIIAQSADQQLQKTLELRLTNLIIETLDKCVPGLLEEVDKLSSVTESRQSLQAVALRVVQDHLIKILDDRLAGTGKALRSQPYISVAGLACSSGSFADLVMPAQAIALEANIDDASTIMSEPSMLLDHLKDFDLTISEHESPAWRAWLSNMKIGPAVLDAVAQRAANLDSVWTAITANPMDKIRPALKAVCWAGILADPEISIGANPHFTPTDETQLKLLASAGRVAERDLASAVTRMHDICSTFIDDYGYVKVIRIHRELTGKYGMASAYAERVGTAYGGAWALREKPGSQDLQRSFAAQLKHDICSDYFAEMLTRIAEQSGDRAICEMLMRRQHDMLHQYCDSVLGASVPS